MKVRRRTLRAGDMVILEDNPSGMLCRAMVKERGERGWRWRKGIVGSW